MEQMGKAAAAAIRVMSSPPLRSVIEELGLQFERATGHKLVIKIEAMADLKRQIVAGDAFDVAILTPVLIDALIKDGKIAPGSHANIARSGLGVAARTGVHMDVGSVDAFKRVLLNAKSVMYATGSAVTTHIERMFDRLGIAEDIASKCKVVPAGGHIGRAIADGAAELGLTHIPVILESNDVGLAGPFPAELQFYVDLAGGVSSSSMEPKGAKALIRYLMASETIEVMKRKGLERFSPQ